MQNQIPEDWQKEELGKILDLLIDHRGITPKKLGGGWSSTGVPALSAKNIKSGQITSKKDIRYVDENMYNRWMPEKLEANDILLTSEAPLGELYFLKDKQDYVLSQRLFGLRVNKSKIDSRYLYYFLSGPIGQEELNRRISGTAAEGIRQAELVQILIDFPRDIENQKKIAVIISIFDDKIEVNNKIAKTLEEMAQTIFKEWFIINKSKLQIKKIKETGRVITGKTPSTKDLLNFGSDYPFVTIPDMTNTFVLKTERYLSQKSADKMKSLLLPIGSICVSCIATVGLVSITTEESITNQQINSVVPNNKEYTYFLYHFFKRNKELLEAFGAGGSTTLIINKSQFENLEIMVPNDSIMQKFHQLVEPMYKKILTISKENQKLVVMRDLLLPKLMKGEIRV